MRIERERTYGDVALHVVLDDGERRVSEKVWSGCEGGQRLQPAPTLRDTTRSAWRLTKHLDEALGGFEEGDGVDAVSVDGHVDERLRAAAI